MSARDDLAGLIWTTSREDEGTISGIGAGYIADVLLAAGWRSPARRIETVEELEALADMAIIRDCLGNVLEACGHDRNGLMEWMATGSDDDDYPVSLPAIVLWEPGDGDE